MHSLFSKIFLAIWASLILLGIAMVTTERQLGGEELEKSRQWLTAHADTAAGLYALDGLPALHRWLHSLRQEEPRRVILFDQQGQPLYPYRIGNHRSEYTADWEVVAGIHRRPGGMNLIVAGIENSVPSLFLATVVERGRLHDLGVGTRIALALLISALVSLTLAHLLSRPLRRLRIAVQRMTAGDLLVRTGSRGGDEIAALAQDFDLMAERLQGMLENRQHLLRDVSHELRSPLTRLRVALELAEQNGDTAKALSRIGKEADELEELVSRLLSLARLDADEVLQQRECVDLGALLQALVNDAHYEAQAAQRQVVLQADSTVLVEGDAVLLRSALENVMRNAIRHTAVNSIVEVRLMVSGQQALVEVCDRGEGVPVAQLQRIFEPFARIAEARDRLSGGHGLGLSISARIINAHQGRIDAYNREGGGLCVRLELPLAENKKPCNHSAKQNIATEVAEDAEF